MYLLKNTKFHLSILSLGALMLAACGERLAPELDEESVIPTFLCGRTSTEIFLREPDGSARSCAYVSGHFAGATDGKIAFYGTYFPTDRRRNIDFVSHALQEKEPDVASKLKSCAPICYGATRFKIEPQKIDIEALEEWVESKKITCPDPSQELIYQIFSETISTVSCQTLHGSYFFIHDENIVSYGAYNKGEQAGKWVHTDLEKNVLNIENFEGIPENWPEFTPASEGLRDGL